jgi:t-SNARE complex subunit (syntaxin)
MSSVHTQTTKGTITAAERVKSSRSANRRLLVWLVLGICVLITTAVVTRILYVM